MIHFYHSGPAQPLPHIFTVQRQVVEKVCKDLEHQRLSYKCMTNCLEVDKLISREAVIGNSETNIFPLICRQVERRLCHPRGLGKPEPQRHLGVI